MKKLVKTLLALLAVMMVVVALTACSKGKSKLVGTWNYETGDVFGELDFDIVYVFNADGTGTYTIAGQVMEFTYETKGNTLYITYKDDTDVFESEFVLDGDTLNIKDTSGTNNYFKKQK